MKSRSALWPTPEACLTRTRPDHPVLFFSPRALQASARRFRAGFPGLVTYAVKANPLPAVMDNLAAAGIGAFDVASPEEMEVARAASPRAVLHYHNPIRSDAEIAAGIAAGVRSWSVDDTHELARLEGIDEGSEVAVRFKLPVKGAVYDFGEKFGATPDEAVLLMRQAAAAGFRPSMTFHPGTQCGDATAWATYLHAAADIARRADLRPVRINVGGGFPVALDRRDVDLERFFDTIGTAARAAFGGHPPPLVCEPGRAMVGDAFSLAARVKAVRADGTVYLNDGLYGGLSDLKDTGLTARVRALSPDGEVREGTLSPRRVFGPTCDSIDKLPEGLELPTDLAPGDYVIFDGMGAYSMALSTRFNGYGLNAVETVHSLSGH